MKVYSGIEGVVKSEPDYKNFDYDKEQARENEYIEQIVAHVKSQNKGAYVGKEARFQVADGYARYIVMSEKPMALIHLDLGDGYNYPYIERLTAKDIKEEVDRREKFESFWKTAKA